MEPGQANWFEEPVTFFKLENGCQGDRDLKARRGWEDFGSSPGKINWERGTPAPSRGAGGRWKLGTHDPKVNGDRMAPYSV